MPDVRAASVLRYESERLGELACCLTIGELSRASLRDHYQVAWRQICSSVAKYLSQDSLDAIALHRVPHASAHGDAQPWPLHLTAPANEDEVRRMTAHSIPLDGQELSPATEPQRLVKAPWAGHGDHPGCFGGMLTVSRLRPLARRRFSTWRPPGVAIRARKPCVRLRRRLLGW